MKKLMLFILFLTISSLSMADSLFNNGGIFNKGSSSGGSQTPWTSAINGNGYPLNDASQVNITNNGTSSWVGLSIQEQDASKQASFSIQNTTGSFWWLLGGDVRQAGTDDFFIYDNIYGLDAFSLNYSSTRGTDALLIGYPYPAVNYDDGVDDLQVHGRVALGSSNGLTTSGDPSQATVWVNTVGGDPNGMSVSSNISLSDDSFLLKPDLYYQYFQHHVAEVVATNGGNNYVMPLSIAGEGGTIGLGSMNPLYGVDVHDVNGTGIDIGDSSTGDWSIANNGTLSIGYTTLTTGNPYTDTPYTNNFTTSYHPVDPYSISGTSQNCGGGGLYDDGAGNIYNCSGSLIVATIDYYLGIVQDASSFSDTIYTLNYTYDTISINLQLNADGTMSDQGNNGVTCNGINVLTFQSVNGFVTHC